MEDLDLEKTYITKNAKLVLKTLARQKKQPMYKVLEDAIFTYSKMREEKLIAVREDIYRELEQLSKVLNLPVNNIIELLMTSAKILFSKKISFYELIKPLPQLIEELGLKENS